MCVCLDVVNVCICVTFVCIFSVWIPCNTYCYNSYTLLIQYYFNVFLLVSVAVVTYLFLFIQNVTCSLCIVLMADDALYKSPLLFLLLLLPVILLLSACQNLVPVPVQI